MITDTHWSPQLPITQFTYDFESEKRLNGKIFTEVKDSQHPAP